MQLDLMCGPCDRLIIGRSLKQKGGKFLGRVLKEVETYRRTPQCGGAKNVVLGNRLHDVIPAHGSRRARPGTAAALRRRCPCP
jgi:hypothetical protein